MNLLFLLLFCSSCTILLFTSPESVLPLLTQSAERALSLCFSLSALYCVWMGVINLLSAAGVHRSLSRVFRPTLRLLLGKTDLETTSFLTLNLSSNLLGLGSAATPAGMEAVKRMDALVNSQLLKAEQSVGRRIEAKTNGQAEGQPTGLAALRKFARFSFSKKRRGFCKTRCAAQLWYEHHTTALFLLNTCMLQLLPTSILSLRASFGSANPADILPAVYLCGIAGLFFAAAVIWLHKRWTERRIRTLFPQTAFCKNKGDTV